MAKLMKSENAQEWNRKLQPENEIIPGHSKNQEFANRPFSSRESGRNQGQDKESNVNKWLLDFTSQVRKSRLAACRD